MIQMSSLQLKESFPISGLMVHSKAVATVHIHLLDSSAIHLKETVSELKWRKSIEKIKWRKNHVRNKVKKI